MSSSVAEVGPLRYVRSTLGNGALREETSGIGVRGHTCGCRGSIYSRPASHGSARRSARLPRGVEYRFVFLILNRTHTLLTAHVVTPFMPCLTSRRWCMRSGAGLSHAEPGRLSLRREHRAQRQESGDSALRDPRGVALSLVPSEPRCPSVVLAAGEIRVHRRDRLGSVVHEYVSAACPGFHTLHVNQNRVLIGARIPGLPPRLFRQSCSVERVGQHPHAYGGCDVA
jgi:hypothetical protein